MPINTNLNEAPYFDDFDIEKKYYRVLFKPAYAVQARELTQLQTILQNQIEQFGDNIFKEGSIVKGCTFTELRNLQYVKVADDIDPTLFVDRVDLYNDQEAEYYYEIRNDNGLRALVISATRGFQSRAPDLNTFYVRYLNTGTTASGAEQKTFAPGDTLTIEEWATINNPETGEDEVIQINPEKDSTTVASFSTPTGLSYGLNVSQGIIFQKGHFLFVEDQTIILTKYLTAPEEGEDRSPTGISVGFRVDEEIINANQDTSLLDNATGSENENAPGADRLKLTPILVSVDSTTADEDPTFFTLRRYENGSAVEIRDVSQYNVIGNEMARRTFEESGDYITKPFKFGLERKTNGLNVKVGPGTVYTKGFRVENSAERFFPIDPVETTETLTNQNISMNYGGYVDVTDSTGKVAISSFQPVKLMRDNGGPEQIGSAIVKNYTGSKLYLFAIRMDKDIGAVFGDVEYVEGLISNPGAIYIDPVLKQQSKSKLLFDIGTPFVKSVSNMRLNVRKYRTGVPIESGRITLSPNADETFIESSTLAQNILVINETNQPVEVTGVDPINQQGQLSFTLDQQTSGQDGVTVYYNVQINPSQPKAKQSYSVYVKTNYDSDKAKYSLGLPDCYKLVSVVDSSGKDFTKSFKLNNNQKENFYDHSYIERITGRDMPTDGETITVNVEVFKAASTGSYHFFTVDSYGDVGLLDIPSFRTKDGILYNLKNCIDFRPYREPIAAYSTNVAGATLVSSLTPGGEPASATNVRLPDFDVSMFNSGESFIVPSEASYSIVDYEFYKNRTDTVVADGSGRFFLVKGEESAFSKPRIERNKTVLATVYVPGYPSYTVQEAADLGNPEYAVSIKPVGVENYTMQDIKDIDEKVERLRYYVVLSALEADTQNLRITDENGLNRFKNGIMVDPFNDLTIADIKDPEFNASVDFTEKSLAPSVKTIPVNMKVKEASGVSIFNNRLATLSSNKDVAIISQEKASGFRNCVSNFYLYKGVGSLSPEYDFGYDVTTNPVNVDLDLASIFEDLVTNLQEFIPLRSSSSNVIGRSFNVTTAGRTTTTETTTVIQDTVRSLQTTTNESETAVGDFVTDIRMNPYMRRRRVKIAMFGLRPNTRHYVFFDGVDVNEHCAPADVGELPSEGGVYVDSISRTGRYGARIKTNENGEFYAIFRIPAETFFVGDRIIDVVDVDSFDNIETAATSNGKLTYRAHNFSVDKSSVTLSTREPDFDVETSTTTRTVTNRTVTVRREEGDGGGNSSCFVAGTIVTMADGSKKNIELVRIGEKLIGQDGSINTVLEFDHPMLSGRQLIGLNGSGPFMTPEHPVFTKEGWKAYRMSDTLVAYPHLANIMVGDLKQGDEIQKFDGTWEKVETLEVFNNEPDQRVYNFILDGNNTYYANGYLVHNRDPLSQTFFIKEGLANDADCVYVSKIDLYFKRKSSKNGVTIMLREVENGYPSSKILPFGKVHLKKSQVNISDDGSSVTSVSFPAPVRMDIEKEYCVVVMPDANDPEYLIFTSKIGLNDLITGRAITQDWGDGVLFTSTNNRAWKSYQDEDIKFTLYRHNFNNSSGSLTLETDDVEFFALSNIVGSFTQGELVYKLYSSTYDVTVTAGSNIVTGSVENFNSGEYLYFEQSDGTKELLKIKSVNTSTGEMKTTNKSTFTGTVAGRLAVAGRVSHFDPRNPLKMTIESSSASSTAMFVDGDNIIGLDSEATATIGDVENVEISYVQPSINRVEDRTTTLSGSWSVIDPETVEVLNANTENETYITDPPYSRELVFNDSNRFNEKRSIIFSKSNDPDGDKNLKAVINFDNSGFYTSTPVVDVDTASLFAYQYKITDNPDTTSKYISKTVTLAEGFDAKDFRLYVNGYRPTGTDIKCYVRIQNATDPLDIDSNPWLELDLIEGNGLFCSTTNINDFREFVYEISTTHEVEDPTDPTAKIVQYENTSGTYLGFKKFQIKIELTSDDIGSVPRLLDYRGIALE